MGASAQAFTPGPPTRPYELFFRADLVRLVHQAECEQDGAATLAASSLAQTIEKLTGGKRSYLNLTREVRPTELLTLLLPQD